MFQICLCGAQPGYPHDPCCPRPLFRATEQQAQEWQQQYNHNVAVRGLEAAQKGKAVPHGA